MEELVRILSEVKQQIGGVLARLDGQDRTLARIEEQLVRQNGTIQKVQTRVASIEGGVAVDRTAGKADWRRFAMQLILTILAALMGALLGSGVNAMDVLR